MAKPPKPKLPTPQPIRLANGNIHFVHRDLTGQFVSEARYYELKMLLDSGRGDLSVPYKVRARLHRHLDEATALDALKRDLIAHRKAHQRLMLNGADLSGLPLTHLDLHDADLTKAKLMETNFTDSNLQGSNLRQADLTQAVLQRTDLSNADLGGANLRFADLREAKLNNAQLDDSNLENANLTRSDLR
ncbi:MAG TPA: pentapeptide repeat-containing protein, partial [Anaerolineae bacterium]|nr:pentapeptide repeat-containing protein [Anaerolineae bacterium]